MSLPLHTKRLILRDFRPGDLADVHAYASNPEVTRHLSWGPNTEEETREFLELATTWAAARPREQFAVAMVDRETDRVLGGTGLHGRNLHFREYEIGYCLVPEAWGRGLASEAVRALLDLGFGELGAHRIYAKVYPEATASAHLLENVGFRREGHQVKDTFVRGAWEDSLIYAMLEEEWGGENSPSG